MADRERTLNRTNSSHFFKSRTVKTRPTQTQSKILTSPMKNIIVKMKMKKRKRSKKKMMTQIMVVKSKIRWWMLNHQARLQSRVSV